VVVVVVVVARLQLRRSCSPRRSNMCSTINHKRNSESQSPRSRQFWGSTLEVCRALLTVARQRARASRLNPLHCRASLLCRCWLGWVVVVVVVVVVWLEM
jgi:hypothetical protein